MSDPMTMEDCGYKGEHHCWTQRCECGWWNWGCVRFGIYCKGCDEPLFADVYLTSIKFPSLEMPVSDNIIIIGNKNQTWKEDYQI